ncbi:tetratricopeptide repeat protein [Acidisphaera sp. S103]|uniref:tetratricopeptide repeat protein n=1 Tax=Acidisphaera sp. S103 TaxID=1747223 RepID=UPI00131DA65A|nr:tetratricopeptide repeat protein [Acidisphaera sp. S103]
MSGVAEGALRRARALVGRGEDEAAKLAYLRVLQADPEHCGALTELGALAHASGFVSAARDAYCQAVRCHPGDKVAHVGYAYLLNESGEFDAAREQYQAALAVDPDLVEAHQGLARVLTEIGENGDEHWRKGFVGHAVVRRRYRGTGTGIPLVMLVAAVGGNIPTQHWVDDRVFAVTAVYADFFDPDDPLPPHAAILNAIGDADLCGEALVNAERIVSRCEAPLVNHPARVRVTGRTDNAGRLGGIAGVVAPRIAPLSRVGDWRFPLLLRAPGYHTGQHFIRVETRDALDAAAASLPRGEPLAIEYLDARGADGMARKYRVMFIGGVAYPLHLAISADWKVHYFTAAMEADAAFREEEKRFLGDMPGVLGPRAMAALGKIQAALGLDYAGVDFALAPDGSLLLFEANATMAIIPLAPDPIWDYRRRAVGDALEAARRLLPRDWHTA